MTQTAQIFRAAVLALWDWTRSCRYDSDEEHDFRAELEEQFNPVSNRRILETLLPSPTQLTSDWGGQHFLLLPRVPKESKCWPLLSVSYDFVGQESKVRLKVFLFSPGPDARQVIGFRLDTPEGTEGIHHFNHVQFLTDLGETRYVNEDCWFPTHSPAWPLDGPKHPAALIACLIVGLYGPADCRNLKLDHLQGIWQGIVEGMASMQT